MPSAIHPSSSAAIAAYWSPAASSRTALCGESSASRSRSRSPITSNGGASNWSSDPAFAV